MTGGMALGSYDYVRTTDDVDIVVTPDDWKRFKDSYLGLGYVEVFPGSKGATFAARLDAYVRPEFPDLVERAKAPDQLE